MSAIQDLCGLNKALNAVRNHCFSAAEEGRQQLSMCWGRSLICWGGGGRGGGERLSCSWAEKSELPRCFSGAKQ